MAEAHNYQARPLVRLLITAGLFSSLLTFATAVTTLEAGTPLAIDSTENKTQNYEAWGQDVNGLRCRFGLVPEKERYSLGEQIGIRFWVENVSEQVIYFLTPKWVNNSCTCIIKDNYGVEQQVNSIIYLGWNPASRIKLEPGEGVMLDSASLGLAGNREQAENFNHPVGHVAVLKAGNYSISFELRFHGQMYYKDSLLAKPGDWAGTLATGTAKLCINPAQAEGIFESYFPDDPEAGKKLDEYWANRKDALLSDEEFFELFRRGLRRCTAQYKGNFLMQHIGSKYIWHKDPDDARALDIVYHASFEPEYKYYAVYSGLSVANPKSERVMKRLVDIAVEYEQLGRIIWGIKASNQEDGFEQLLETYLQDPNAENCEHARIVLKAFRGEIDAGKWERQWKQEQHEQRTISQFGSELPRIKEVFLTGSSQERLEAVEFVWRNNIALSMDNDFIEALDACSQDGNPAVRARTAVILGNNFIWAKDTQPDEVIEILMRLSADEQRDVRYKAVYHGLSVVDEKSDTVVKRLIDIALTDDEHNMYGRCCWALQDNQKAKEILRSYAEDNELDQEKVKQLYQQLFQEDSIQIPPAAEPSPVSATDLNTVVTLTVSEQTPFIDALDELKSSDGGKLNLTVFWRDLERAGIDKDTPVQVGPIEAVPLKTALKLLLNAVAGEDGVLDYRVLDGVIVIATRPTLAKFGPETRIYDITDLSAPPGEYRTRTSSR